MKKILYITGRYPYPLFTGDRLRAYYQISELSKRNTVDLFSMEPPLIDVDMEEFGVNTSYSCGVQHHNKLINAILKFNIKNPVQVSMYDNIDYHEKLIRVIRNGSYDVIIFQLSRLCSSYYYVRDYCDRNDIVVYYDFVDSLALNMKNRSDSESFIKSVFFKRESNLIRDIENHISSDQVCRNIAISKRDALEINNNAKFDIIPNGVGKKFSYQNRDVVNIVFFGNLSYFPNVKAVNYISNELLPISNGRYCFNIVGINPSNEVLKLHNGESLVVHGFVEDIEKFCENMDLSIFPIFSGSGLQNKVLESLSMGIPVIASPNVSEIIDKSGTVIYSAEHARDFIAIIESLSKNCEEREIASKKGVNLVKEKYSWSQINDHIV